MARGFQRLLRLNFELLWTTHGLFNDSRTKTIDHPHLHPSVAERDCSLHLLASHPTSRCGKRGGEGGIRTPETLPSLHALQACALNRARPPLRDSRPVWHMGSIWSATSNPPLRRLTHPPAQIF